MRFDNAFDVQAPIGEVWTAMLDVERVAPCVPGAEVLEQVSDSSYRVGIKIRIGPIVQQYRGEIEIVESDESTHRAVMKARAREMRGQGRAEATVDLRLTEEGAGTHGDMAADVSLSGPAAAMGRGIIQDVSSRIVEDFSKNLAAMLAGGPTAPTAEAPTLAAPTFSSLAAERPEPEEPAPLATPGAPETAAPAPEEATPEETPSAGPLPEAVPELHVPEPLAPERPAPIEPPPVAAVPDVAAPDEPTAELPIPSGPPDTAPAPQSGLAGGPPAGPAEEAALGEPIAGPAAAAATGGPSAGATPPEPPAPPEPPRPPEPPAPPEPPRPPEPPPPPPPTSAPPRPEPPTETEAALPVLSILGDVARKRLREPKVIGGLVGAVVVIGLLRRRRR